MFLKGSPAYFRFFVCMALILLCLTSLQNWPWLSFPLIWLFTSHDYSLCAAASSREHWRRGIWELELEWSVRVKMKRPERWVQHLGGEVILSGLKSEWTALGRSMGQCEAPASVGSLSPEATSAATPQHLTSPSLLTLRRERKQCDFSLTSSES